jgi:hypothetical protein
MDFLSRQTGEQFFNHPHTWLIIRIFASLRLFMGLDFFCVFLILDVVRTLFLAVGKSVNCQTTFEDNGKSVDCQTDIREDADNFGELEIHLSVSCYDL